MLAVLDNSVAKCPEALLLRSPQSLSVSALKDGFMANYFTSQHPAAGSVVINLASSGFRAYSSHKQKPILPRLFGVVDDIFCLFEGHIENVAHLKQQYGINKTANEVMIVIEAYKTLRDRGPYPVDQVARDIQGKFEFILFDNASKAPFIASVSIVLVVQHFNIFYPFVANVHWYYWYRIVTGVCPCTGGTDAEGRLVLSSDEDMVKQCCGKSVSLFPKGCFFTSSGGLRSYEHPIGELKAVPKVDSSGEICGLTFKVDEDARKGKTGMPRVGSDTNWSQRY